MVNRIEIISARNFYNEASFVWIVLLLKFDVLNRVGVDLEAEIQLRRIRSAVSCGDPDHLGAVLIERRSVEVAKLMNEAGLICIAGFVAPSEEVRRKAAGELGEERLLVVHLSAPVEVCRERDQDGH